MTKPHISPEDITRCILLTQEEIKADVKALRVPRTCGSFSELHDYVDANMYGEEALKHMMTPEGIYGEHLDEVCDAKNLVSDAVDQWIKGGGLL